MNKPLTGLFYFLHTIRHIIKMLQVVCLIADAKLAFSYAKRQFSQRLLDFRDPPS
jgi:hypothetical protein